MILGPRARISPSGAIRISTPGMGFPTVPNRMRLERVGREDGSGFGQAVAFEDDEPQGVEELGDVLGKRGAAGDEEADPPARLGDDLGEDEPVGDGPPEREARGDRGARDLQGAVRPAHAGRPEKDLPLEPGARQDVVHDLGVDLLEDPRNADHDVGPDLEEILADRLDALGVGDRAALVDVGERDHPLEDVGQGKEGEDGVLRREKMMTSATPMMLLRKLPWVRMTPFGTPVVPDV